MTATAVPRLRLGVVHVYDPQTGIASWPVAAAAWTDDQAWWAWIPRDPYAEQLRHTVIDDLPPEGQVDWLITNTDSAGIVAGVDVIDHANPTADPAAIRQTLIALLGAVIVEAY